MPQEVIDRVKGSANTVEISADEEWEVIVDDVLTPLIDKPNTAALARKVVLRDGACCANCKRRLGLHAHHIRFRSKGGRTVLANECAVCVRCHALLHAGLLKICGNPIDGITFHTRAEEMTEEFLKEAEEDVASVPVLIVSPAKEAGAEEPSGRPETIETAPAEDQSVKAVAPEDSGRPESEAGLGADPGEQSGAGVRAAPPAAPKAVGSSSPAGRPAEENEAVEITEAALRTLGFRAREASEAAERARENLLRQGRAALTIADSSDLLREAFRPRWSKDVKQRPPRANTDPERKP